MKYFIKYLVIILLVLNCAYARNKVFVDNSGILKWTASKEPVALFGVNYTVPFAHSYRSIKKLGLSHKKAIDTDVSQFARLELEAYRIHVWDREVSDSLGNLLENEHLDLLDYLISRLKEKGINIILTPIAWWGPGWPEPDQPSPGFTNNYSKTDLVVVNKAREIQKNYLKQFLNHTNKYTGLSYKNDPDIIAFEIINEPKHSPDTSVTTAYINEMAAVFRGENVTKPIYYNISENWSTEQAAAVYNANIDGISFQWYPTGLVKYSELTGNYLAHVDHYPIPEFDDKNFKNKTRMVYEFDAADIAQSVMYPAMARSFREAGMQWATMFSYDPSFLAGYNTEYSTHYINLLYTPQKAISLMIAANVFREVDVFQKFKSYPYDLDFGDFHISYADNLSLMNSDYKFYYSNSTNSLPKDLKNLQHVAGVGSSAIVKTNATGAYFLDKINQGVWRLELYPDVVHRMDPFGRNSLDKKVRLLLDKKSEINIELPGLSEGIFIYDFRVNESFRVQSKTISVHPGVYLLSNSPVIDTEYVKYSYRNRTLTEYPTVDTDVVQPEVIHKEADFIYENTAWEPEFKIFSSAQIDTAILYLRQPGWRGFRPIGLKANDKYTYTTRVDKGIQNGIIEYCLYVKTDRGEMTFPSEVAKNPNDWDYFPTETWKLKIVPDKVPLILFNPGDDYGNLIFPNVWGIVTFRAHTRWDDSGDPWLGIELADFKRPLDEFTFQVELDNKLENVDLKKYRAIEFEVDTTLTNLDKMYCRIVDSNLKTRELEINKKNISGKIEFTLDAFKNGEFVLLPRPYPHFLPYSFKSADQQVEEPAKLNFIQFTIPANDWKEEKLQVHISAIKLIK